MAADLDRLLENWFDPVIGSWMNPLHGLALLMDGRESARVARGVIEGDTGSRVPVLDPVPAGPVLLVNQGHEAIRVRLLQTEQEHIAVECLTGYLGQSDMQERELAPRQTLTIPGSSAYLVLQIVTPGACLIRPVGLVGRGPATLSLGTYTIHPA